MRVSRAKKIGVIAAIFLLLCVLFVLALPFWMPLAVGPILSRFGVEYAAYERVGYGRFALTEVTSSTEAVEGSLGRVEGFIPTAWLWKKWRGKADHNYLSVDDWRVEIREAKEGDETDAEEVSVHEIVGRVEAAVAPVSEWLPHARVGPGEVVLPDRTIDVEEITWRGGVVEAKVSDRTEQQAVELKADLRGGLPFVLRGETEPFPLGLEVIVSRAGPQVLVESEFDVAGNLVTADADFNREGFLPERAQIHAPDLRIPPAYLALEGYQELTGSFLLDWRDELFSAELWVKADPSNPGSRLPPLRADASVRGDLESLVMEMLEIHSPWLDAALSDPVALTYDGRLLTDESVLEITADLTEQPFLDLTGTVQGAVFISPGTDLVPFVRFDLTGTKLAGYDVEAENIGLRGSLQWPDLSLAELTIDGADASSLLASGEVNLDTREVASGRVEGAVQSNVVARWLPPDAGFSVVRFESRFEGAMADLRHGGWIEVEQARFPGLHTLNGRLEWEGRMTDLASFSLDLAAGAGALAVTGSAETGDEKLGIILDHVRLEHGGQLILESKEPSSIRVEGGETRPLLVALDQLHWSGPGREIMAAAEIFWPERGSFSAKARGLSTEMLADFVEVKADVFTLASAEVEGKWQEGPVDFRALADVSLQFNGSDEILVEVDATGEKEEFRIERLRATSEGELLAMAEGTLPATIRPGDENLLHVREQGEIRFVAETSPQARFWREIGDLSGVYLEDPRLSLEVTGTPAQPSGRLSGAAPIVRWKSAEKAEQPAPEISELELEVNFSEKRIAVENLSLLVEGQAIEAQADIPMGRPEWEAVIQGERLPDWTRASGRLRIPEAEVAAFARFAPSVLSPQGQISADVELREGGLFDGVISVENAATRPLMPFGAIREGTARLALRERTLELKEISAVVGGERLTVTGSMDLPIEQQLAYDIKIKGRNLPLARKPGLVIRGDLNLTAQAKGDEVPLIAGQVDLHDSFYFAHLRLMPSGAVATPSRRPPFFSIEHEPFNQWKLDVDLRGPGFLDVRGPIFQGKISANFDLAGTLEEPVALGAATLDSGQIRFPFASLTIQQGEISLRRENPFQPQLFIVAGGMAFGYDLRMEITGTGQEPIIEFFSNPPLTSEQALLMVTTGELPRDEIRFTSQQRASRFAIYFGRNLLYELTGDDSASDRLVIRSGEQVSEGGRETMVIEYRLTENWSVLGEYDRFDEYNVGLKWNIFSR